MAGWADHLAAPLVKKVTRQVKRAACHWVYLVRRRLKAVVESALACRRVVV
jgi:hypothetical protein